MSYPELHLYAQYSFHTEARILGSRAGLEALRDAISSALETGAQTFEAVAGDGEGYDLQIVVVDDLGMAPMPYTAGHAQDHRKEAWDLLARLVGHTR